MTCLKREEGRSKIIENYLMSIVNVSNIVMSKMHQVLKINTKDFVKLLYFNEDSLIFFSLVNNIQHYTYQSIHFTSNIYISFHLDRRNFIY